MYQGILESLRCDGDELLTECDFPRLGKSITIVFDAMEGGQPSVQQKLQLKWLISAMDDLFSQIEEQVYAYYNDIFDVYRAALDEYADELMPKLTCSADVWGYVTEPSLWFTSDQNDNDVRLEYETSFDMEHGLTVVINKGKIVSVGI